MISGIVQILLAIGGLIKDGLNTIGAFEVGKDAITKGTSNAALELTIKGLQQMGNQFKALEKIDYNKISPLGQLSYWDETYSKLGQVNVALGVGGQLASELNSNAINSLASMESIGAGLEDATKVYQNFIEGFGKNVLFSSEDLNNVVKLNKITNDGFNETLVYANLIGKSVEDSYDFINKSIIKADKLGLNATKYIKDISKNYNLLVKYNFKNGVDGLSKMVALSNKTKINMESATGLAEKAFTLEGAIDISSQLTALGGQYANLFSNPMELAFDARNNPEKILERLTKVSKDMVTIGADGQLQISALNRRVLQEFSSITGVDTDELIKSSLLDFRKEAIKSELALKNLGKVSDEELAKLSNVASFSSSGEIMFNFGEEGLQDIEQTINNLQSNMNKLNPIGDSTEDRILAILQSNASVGEQITRAFNTGLQQIASTELYDKIAASSSKVVDMTNLAVTGLENVNSNFLNTLKSLQESGTEQLKNRFDLLMDMFGSTNDGLGGSFDDLFAGSDRFITMLESLDSSILGVGEKLTPIIKGLGSEIFSVEGLKPAITLLKDVGLAVFKSGGLIIKESIMNGLIESYNLLKPNYWNSKEPIDLDPYKPFNDMLKKWDIDNLKSTSFNDTSESDRKQLEESSFSNDKFKDLTTTSNTLNSTNIENVNKKSNSIGGTINIHVTSDTDLGLTNVDFTDLKNQMSKEVSSGVQDFLLDFMTSGDRSKNPNYLPTWGI